MRQLAPEKREEIVNSLIELCSKEKIGSSDIIKIILEENSRFLECGADYEIFSEAKKEIEIQLDHINELLGLKIISDMVLDMCCTDDIIAAAKETSGFSETKTTALIKKFEEKIKEGEKNRA